MPARTLESPHDSRAPQQRAKFTSRMRSITNDIDRSIRATIVRFLDVHEDYGYVCVAVEFPLDSGGSSLS